jgi:uncharacterized membrane protein YhaH (DUF805 family)
VANLAAAPRSPVLWVLFGLRGRISRGVYWLAYLGLTFLDAVLVMQLLGESEASYYQLAEILMPVVLLVTLYSNVAIAVKRLHDMGYGGIFALALFVPFVNLAFTIWVGLVPGTTGANAFGERVDRPPQ